MDKTSNALKCGFWAGAIFVLAILGEVGITVLGELAGQWKIVNPVALEIAMGFIVGIVVVSSIFFAYGAKTEDTTKEKQIVPREDIEEFSASASRFSPKVVRLKTKAEREQEAKEKEPSTSAPILPQFADADNGRDFSGEEVIVASNNVVADNVVPDNDEYDDNDLLDFLASVDSQNDVDAYSA